MSTSSSKLSEKGKQKLADFAKEKDARRASFSAETGGPIEGKLNLCMILLFRIDIAQRVTRLTTSLLFIRFQLLTVATGK